MAPLKSRHWVDLTWEDFQAIDMSLVTAVLPVAAIEQHGPHLPVGVDSFVMKGYLKRVLEGLPDDLPVLFLPVQAIGTSKEHVEFPGTLTLSPETVIRAWAEIGDSIARTGCRKLVIANSHGGNVSVLDIVARDLRERHGMLVVTPSFHRFGYPEGLYEADELRYGIHAGDIETSLMLSFRPDLVMDDRIENFVPASVGFAQDFAQLRVTSPIGFGWMAQDLSRCGAMGDAAVATTEKGEASAAYGAAAFINLLRDVQRFDLARLPNGPLRR